MTQFDLVISQNIASGSISFVERLITASKGFLLTANGNSEPVALPAGTNGKVLMSDSNETAGIKWATLDELNSLGTNFENLEIVVADGTPEQNFTRLNNIYSGAKIKTPNGAALSATNRYQLLIMPGVYTGDLAINTQFIDLISFDGEKSVKINGTLTVSASDVRLSGLVATQISIGNNLPALIVNKCEGLYAYTVTVSGTFIDCVGSSLGLGGSTLSGTFVRCSGSVSGIVGFGNGAAMTGTFLDCCVKLPSSIGATAKLYNCILQSGLGSFPNPAAGGMLYSCVNGDGSIVNTTDGASGKQLVNYSQLALKFDSSNVSNNIAGDAASTTKVLSVKEAKTYIDNIVAAQDAMVFKGTVGTGGTYTIAAFNSLTTYNCGWTFRIIEAGTVKGKVCENGDLIMATVDRNVGGAVDADWVIGQGNIDGAVVGPASAVDGHVALFNGITGKLIKDGGALGTMAFAATADYVSKTMYDDTNTVLIRKSDVLSEPSFQAVGLNTNSFLGRLEGDITSFGAAKVQELLSNANSVPASKTAAGTKGYWASDSNFFYLCLTTGTAGNALWARWPIASDWTN